MKSSWVETRTERDQSPITVTAKTELNSGKLILFITNQMRVG